MSTAKKCPQLIFLFAFIILFHSIPTSAQNKIISGPSGSGQFGRSVIVLPNGNYVVTDPLFDNANTDVGAVYLYNGATHALISTLTGSTANDQVGSNGIIVLTNGNYLVSSSLWDNGTSTNAGAVTWCNAVTGKTGVVSASNSIVGSTSNDQVGYIQSTILTNGNYVLRSYVWDNGSIVDAGAATWCNGTIGRVGTISASNSLVGTSNFDYIGRDGITALPNGNYVVISPFWSNGATGAVTWCDGAIGCVGAISASNSLIGFSNIDNIGGGGITVLANGNYVVCSPHWTPMGLFSWLGAVTWCDGTTGRVGIVDSSNSLVGSASNDEIGDQGITALSNGNYVVQSSSWSNGTISNVGAVTWCNGTTGRIGAVNTSNSLVGSLVNDFIGNAAIVALNNGNYVVNSPFCDNGPIVDAGAVTWCNGTTGGVGSVNIGNSLMGSSANDQIGRNGITSLKNGNYVVHSSFWDSGSVINAGAVTWCNGTIGRSGLVSANNSLIGSTMNDLIGNYPSTTLTNGNYVVSSRNWDNGVTTDAGAATWCNGTTGKIGAINTSNSLVGTSDSDQLGAHGIIALTNGNYVVNSSYWDNGTIINAGATTWCDGAIGRAGIVNVSNSLVGTSAYDFAGNAITTSSSNGNYLVRSPYWDNGATIDIGALTWCDGSTGRIGAISINNSLVGSSTNDQIGNTIVSLPNKNLVIYSIVWDNGAIANAGAITITPDSIEIIGQVNSCNSVLGDSTNPAPRFIFHAFNPAFNYLMVSKPVENKIVIRLFSRDSSLYRTICSNQSYLWNGIARNTSGAYKDTFTSFSGCDSIVTLYLTVNPISTSTINQTICSNQSYIWKGIARNTTGSYNDTFISSLGCDSIVTLNLTVNPTSSSSFNQTICANQSFLWNGIARNTSGAFKDTFTSFSGCDSVVTLNLTVNPTNSSSINQTICSNQSFLWNGIARNTSGAYKDTFTSFSGCDSIVTLNLTVKPTSSNSFNQTICANQSFLWNGIARNTSGAFKDTFTSFSGCDSVVTLNLTVSPLPSKLTNTAGNTITAAQAGATYQWINCANNTIIAGANAQTFTPSFNGSFKVVVTQNNCSDTSACVPINSVGLNQNNLSSQVHIYPNPARESLTVSLSDEDFNASIVLLSLDGKKIQTYPLNQKTNTLPISHLAPGFYLYEISFRGNIEKGKLLIQE